MGRKIGFISTILFFFTASCIKPYQSEFLDINYGYLVVESKIDIQNDSSFIKLSRTQSLETVNLSTPISDATLWIDSEDGEEIILLEKEKGIYEINAALISLNEKYRLNIETQSGETFQSTYVPVTVSPAIDSVTWDIDANGINIYLNSHDPQNNTFYYRWDYIETAEYNSRFRSTGMYDEESGMVVPRNQETDNIYICWRHETVSPLILGNTTRLMEDIISRKRITSVPKDSWKHRFRYSILVKQFALTEEEYFFWFNIQQSNENVGSLFDAQPSNDGSNIVSLTNPVEPVLGFFNISLSSEKRIFIDQRELPRWEKAEFIPSVCLEAGPAILSLDDFFDDPYKYEIWNLVYDFSGNIVAVTTSNRACIDCSFQNRGSPVRPGFW